MKLRFLLCLTGALLLGARLAAKDLVVAADGSGEFTTVQAAIDAAPANSQERTLIIVKRGTYEEMPHVRAEKKNLTIRGEERARTIIAATNNARLNPRRRELFTVEADGFVLENLTLHNTTPKGGSQAETIHVRADRVLLRRCDFKSFQDTLRLNGRVYVDECYVEGDVDYVWGSGTVYFNRCRFHSLYNGYLVQSRNDATHYGYVFVDCTLTGAPGIERYVLARIEPGRFPDSHVAFIDCKIGSFLSPTGWLLDKAPNAADVAPADRVRYWEYHNTDLDGKPLDVSKRIPVAKQISAEEAAKMRDAAHVLGGWTPPPAEPLPPQEIPVPKIKTTAAPRPGVDELPVRKEMPEVLVMNDGTKVTSTAQWPKRRQEILETLEYYAVGHAPPAPGNVKGRELSSQLLAGGKFRYRLVHLTFGPGEKLSLDIGIFTPAEGGPFPAVIAPTTTPPGATPLPRLPNGPTQGRGLNVLLVVGGATGATTPAPGTNAAGVDGQWKQTERPAADPERIAATNAALARGYAYVIFNNNDCGEDTTLRSADGSWAFRNTRFFPAYPGHDWGLLRSWAWGVSRIVDYLETDPAIDKTKLIVTGASRTGKSAMVAAAFDERLAMGAPVVTGGGGIGAYRFAGPRKSETLDVMLTKYPNWFGPNLHEFRGRREKLPFDEHWFLAACAPRAFLALEGDADTISYPEAVRQSMLGAKPAYALLGVADRLGVNYGKHGHAFTPEDWAALLDFSDQHLVGKKGERIFDRFPTTAELDAALARTAAR